MPVEGVEMAEEDAELGGDKPRLDRPSRSTPESEGAGRRTLDIRGWEGGSREDIFWNFLGDEICNQIPKIPLAKRSVFSNAIL